MTKELITKEELHKLIDGLDMDKLNNEDNTIDIISRIGETLIYILKESQKPKELTLHEKLINEGFCIENENVYYSKGIVEVLCYEKFIRVRCKSYYNEQLNIHDINNHAKVFEAIEFLTKWQS